MEALPGAKESSPVFLAIPLLTIVLIGLLVFWVGEPRPIVSARVWGGPTEGVTRWTGWLEAGTWSEGWRPLAGARIRATAHARDGAGAECEVVLDESGQGELAFDFGERAPGRFRLVVRHADRVLAEDDVEISLAEWGQRASRRGGYFPVSSRGAGALRIAPARGAFAVPFESPLWMRAERDGRAAAGARIRLTASGARARPESAVTSEKGLALVSLLPSEHAVTLNATLTFGDGAVAELSASVPVVPGASIAERRDGALLVRSPVERSEVFVTLVSEEERHFGARVPLRPDGQGLASGSLPLPPTLPVRSWAVVQSAREVPPSEVIGWPLFIPELEPAFTFDVSDARALDGFVRASAREIDRQQGVHRIALGIGLAGAFFSALTVFLNVRRQSRRLTAHLHAQLTEEGDRDAVLERPARGGMIVAITLIALGFLLTAAVAAWRLG